MALSSSAAIFLVSLLGIPLSFIVNTVTAFHGERGLFLSGVGSLLLVCFLVYFTVGKQYGASEPFIYVLVLGTFSSVVDFIIALENENIVTGFTSEYLTDGEPYLTTPYGSVLCAWDGIGHYSMYLLILIAMAQKKDYRQISLYWVGSIGHSITVFIPGNIIGTFGVRWSFLLNIPYIIMPFAMGAYFLNQRPKKYKPIFEVKPKKTLSRKLVDIMLVLGLFVSMILALYRGLAVIGDNKHDYFQFYIKNVEPYLKDPVSYPKVQMLIYLFYFVPYYVMAIYGRVTSSCDWMSDWSLIHAGAAAQAQATHIGGSIHPRASLEFLVPPTTLGRSIFWTVNLFLLVFPQIFAYYSVQPDDKRVSQVGKKQT